MWFDEEKGNYFIVVLADDSFSIDDEKRLSERYDMADTGTMDEVVGVYKIKEGKFYAVKSGRSYKINTDEEMPLRYAASELVIQRLGRHEVVGTVTHTDH